jgi:hypothetical protein
MAENYRFLYVNEFSRCNSLALLLQELNPASNEFSELSTFYC